MFNYRLIKISKMVLLLGVILLMSSCIRSLQPFFEKQDLFEDPDLVGVWIDEEDKQEWIFKKGEELSYVLALPVTEKTSASLYAHLGRLGEKNFINLFPKDSNKSVLKSDLYKRHLIPAHTISRIKIEPNQLLIEFLDGDWLTRQIKKGDIKIKYTEIDFQILLTDSPEELRKMIVDLANIDEAFKRKVRLKRKLDENGEPLKPVTKPPVNPVTTNNENNVNPVTPANERVPFEFHSSFWINLHHYLYQQAQLRELHSKPATGQRTGGPLQAPDALDRLTPAQLQQWQNALNYYTQNLIKKDLLFDAEMGDLKIKLSQARSIPDLKSSGVAPELMAILEQAAPVYRVHWWPVHDQNNQKFITEINPLIKRYQEPIITQLEQAYRAKYPAQPIYVDVSNYGGWYGAYTTSEPNHITIAANDRRHEGMQALEIIFHEASHVFIDQVLIDLEQEFQARKQPPEKTLWHAVLFYTTGEVVRRILVADGLKDYQPYAYRNGLYSRGFKSYQQPLERHWQQYLDGKLEYRKAISLIADELKQNEKK